MHRNIETFNELWEKKIITKPLVIVYGGYAGTGKSTNCNKIAELIKYTTNLPTGVIRSTINDYLKSEEQDILSVHTYDLHKVMDPVNPNSKEGEEEIIKRFLMQIKPISKAINSIISFVASEKQHLIIDGNHVFPGLININPNVHFIEFYNKVSDPNKHKEMLCGPTHNRDLDQDEFTTARILHDYTVAQCIANNKTAFEYNTSTEKMIEDLGRIIGEIIEPYYKGVSLTPFY